MSNSRQFDDEVLVRSFGVTFSVSTMSPPKSESWDQLVYAIQGVLTVKSEVGTWVVPPHRAVWLPADTEYSLAVSGQTALRMIYLRKSRSESREGFGRSRCVVVSISPLLRELIIRTIKIGALEAGVSHHQNIAALIEDELLSVEAVPLQLPYPTGVIGRHFVTLFEDQIEGAPVLSDILTQCGSSRRTMERLFQAETGMSLGRWTRRRKLLYGLQSLLKGSNTNEVAFQLGYSTPSAFIAMFKRELGSTPTDYIATD